MKIRSKIVLLVFTVAFCAFAGFGVFLYTTVTLQRLSRDLTYGLNHAMAGDYFARLHVFLNSIQEGAGVSRNLGETFYEMRALLPEAELKVRMTESYHRAFAMEPNLLGGGAFYAPYTFDPAVEDFHYFASKSLNTIAAAPSQIYWMGDEWEWDVATYEEDWYQVAVPKGWDIRQKRDQTHYWSELYIDASVNALMVTISMPMYDRADRIIGVATVDIPLKVLEDMVRGFSLLTPSSQIVGFSTINNATFAITGKGAGGIVSYPSGGWLERFLSPLKPGDALTETTLSLENTTYSLYTQVHASGIGLAILVPHAEAFQVIDAMQRSASIMVMVVCFVMLGALGVAFVLSASITKPIVSVALTLKDISEGAGDLTQTVNVRSKDEIGDMARHFNAMLEKIKALVITIKNQSATLFDIGR
ncbi:MAG: HAMP domain-containing protein, partial [Treponema sp.]|nr:HAMP domain-containing protein [Treponema sp.]